MGKNTIHLTITISIAFVFLMAIISLFIAGVAHAQLTEPATYTQTHVAGVWGRAGYLNGPALGAMMYPVSMTMDAAGNIYMFNLGRGIIVIDAATQRVWNLAGMGQTGYKDGPAQSAMFHEGAAGYSYVEIAIDSNGALYLADGQNHAIRKIWKDPAHGYQWWVSTYATTLGNPAAVTVDSSGNVWTQDSSGLYKIAPNLTVTKYPNAEYGKTCARYGTPEEWDACVGSAVYMAADAIGNIYTATRDPWYRIYKVDASNGHITKIVGSDWVPHQGSLCYYYGIVTFTQATVPTAVAVSNIWLDSVNLRAYRAASVGADEIKAGEWEPQYMADGPPLDAVVYQEGNLAVSPDGTAVYWGNGDESNLRRLKDGYVMTLYRDGWHTNVCMFQGRSSYSDWLLGGPLWVTANGTIYLYGNNPPDQLMLRKIVPVP